MSHPSDILSLVSEAAILVKNRKIAYMNSAAEAMLGSCTGKSLKAIFGPETANAQGSFFITSAVVGGKRYILRMSKLGGEQVLFLIPQELPPAILNEPFLCTMRNSLMSIGMAADHIRSLAEDAGQKSILASTAVLTRSYYRLIRLAENASLVLSTAAGSPLPGECTVNFSQLCRSLIDTAAFFRPDIHFSANLGEDISCSANPNLLRQLIMNLISNCLVHAEGCTNISVSLSDSADSVVLSVSNDGKGIEAGKLHMAFDRFRHSFDLAEMNAGPGLGLTVVRLIAESHGGTLLLESRADRGTTVRVSFSRRPRANVSLCAPQSSTGYTREVLISLADCLPAECYTEKYMD